MSQSPRPVVTRFAPSPTGSLHIGGARTALFNWLFARNQGGKFLLRIEDTDRARSSDANTAEILAGLSWLGLDWDGEPISQFERAGRHAEVAREMLASGKAYKCFSTPEEIEAYREARKAEGDSYPVFLSPWRDADPSTHPDRPYAIRIKAPRDGETVIEDAVQGTVRVKNATLDDMILLRSDGTPVYMLAVVVDDHDMGVTHVIRGDDHLNNAFRQQMVYDAMGWDIPVWAHIPLIFGPDGKKLSKRHGATAAAEYQAMGYPSAGMRNYLTRLGWSHGDDEFFSDAQAREWFNLEGIGRAPARLDIKKLEHLCGQHIAAADNVALVAEIEAYLAKIEAAPLTEAQRDGLTRAMYCLQERAKTLPELLEKGRFVLINHPVEKDEKSVTLLDDVSRGILKELTLALADASWDRETLEAVAANVAEKNDTKMGKIAGPLRAALAGRTVTPSVFDMMLILGREESLLRLEEASR